MKDRKKNWSYPVASLVVVLKQFLDKRVMILQRKAKALENSKKDL